MISGVHIRSSHLKLIASSHVRNSLRSGSGVIFLVLALLAGLVLATIAVFPSDQALTIGELFGSKELDPETPMIEDVARAPNADARREALDRLRDLEKKKTEYVDNALKDREGKADSAVGRVVDEHKGKWVGINKRFLQAIDKGDVVEIQRIREEQRPVETKMGIALAFEKSIHSWGPSVVGTVTNMDDDDTSNILEDKPALISLFMLLLTLFLPFLTALGAFNQTAGDIGTRGLRYLLLRTERANVYLGRMIGTYLFTLTVITVIIAVVGIYLMIKVPFYSSGDMFLALLRGWFMCAIFALPWVALCAWISALIPMPFLSLLVSAGGLAFWVIINAIARSKADAAEYVSYLTPWGFKWWLYSANIGKVLGGVAIMLAFTALFVFLGLRYFNRRDV
jgi:hypothetical protein